MLKERIDEEIRNESNLFCGWAVCYDIPGEYYDDRKERTSIVATFRHPANAEDFIKKCMPEETKSRFYIVRM